MSLHALAQDIHFSQFDFNPVLYNPAYAGFFEGRTRLGLAYRNQWASVSRPFSTFAATAEIAIRRNPRSLSGFSVALTALHDRAGQLNYGSTSASAIIAYFISPTGFNDNFVSAAIETGYGQTGFDPDNANLFDPTEIFLTPHHNYPTIHTGIAWYYQASQPLTLRLAFAARNINRPHISFLDNDSLRLAIHYNILAQLQWQLTDQITLQPLVGTQLQQDYYEWLYGLSAKWTSDTQQPISFSLGSTIRHKDALIFSIQAELAPICLYVAYDINTSRLAATSHHHGAIELGLIYRHLPPRHRHRSLPCPIM